MAISARLKYNQLIMKKRAVLKLSAIIAIILSFMLLPAQPGTGYEFIQQDITEIVYALSVFNEKPIVCDDTVTGRASFRFAGTDLSAALDSFLSSNRLYVTKDDDAWVVSKIRIEQLEEAGHMNIDAYDTQPTRILEKISEAAGIPIIHETLPNLSMSVHLRDVTAGTAAATMMKSWPEYETTVEETCVRIQRVRTAQQATTQYTMRTGTCEVFATENGSERKYAVNLEKCTLGDAIEELFRLEGSDFCNLARPETQIERLSATDKTFREALGLVCAQCNASFTFADGVYIIFASQEASQKLMKEERKWTAVSMSNMKTDEMMPLIQNRFKDISLIRLSDMMLLFETTDEQTGKVKEFIELCDIPKKTFVQPREGKCEIIRSTASGTDGSEKAVYTLNLEKCRVAEALEALFTEEGADFCNLTQNDTVIARLVSTGKSFDETLGYICAQCGMTFTKSGELYVIHQTADSAQGLIAVEKEWRSAPLRFIQADDLTPLLQARFPGIKILKANDRMLMFEAETIQTGTIEEFIASCDVSKETHVLKLQYIKPSDFLEHLPPTVTKEQFADTGSGNTLFFTGSDEAFALLKEQQKEIDRPLTRLRYDLLILQVQENTSDKWNISTSAKPAVKTDATGIAAILGSVLSLNFDVLSTFGYNFAMQLQTAISESKAEVFADTTLHGVSGTNIQFKNTNTYRYRDPYVDPTTGETKNTGVTREIVSGLILDIEGWVSGDGMVTTTVKATVSRQGADVSNTTGNPPPTYEKQITTQVRGMAGEPVILTGLKQTDMSESEQGVPWISKVPIIGWLFKGSNDNMEKTEMVIYLVPHIDNEAVQAGIYPAEIQKKMTATQETDTEK